MLMNDFLGHETAKLGFGAMRLPLLEDGSIDEAQTFEMVDLALANGVNYFDTAYPYMGGKSEIVLGKALARHPRESFLLATKYPGHQQQKTHNPAAIFEDQLKKCGVEYFDFYLLHNLYELSLPVYMDDDLGLVEYFYEQKMAGRIKHLGISTHGRFETVKAFLDKFGNRMDFVQIQLNYLDWTLRNAKQILSLCMRNRLPVVVMEPLRGGALCQLEPEQMAKLEELRPGATATDWALRWQLCFPAVKVVLSGMSSLEQVRQNIATFDDETPLSKEERAAIEAVAETMKNNVPCTGCRYCVEECPMGLDIPSLMESANDTRAGKTLTQAMYLEGLSEDEHPRACTACGACQKQCPQGIDIPTILAELVAYQESMPSWAAMCAERNAAAEAMRNE